MRNVPPPQLALAPFSALPTFSTFVVLLLISVLTLHGLALLRGWIGLDVVSPLLTRLPARTTARQCGNQSGGGKEKGNGLARHGRRNEFCSS
jgi:hypothetical protein